MGRAARWLKALFGIKKDKEQNQSSNAGDRRNLGSSGRGETALCQNPATIPSNITQAEAAWLKSFYNDSEKEHSKHSIDVAATTAAAVNAAVAAAEAAVAVVRLPNQGVTLFTVVPVKVQPPLRFNASFADTWYWSMFSALFSYLMKS